MDGLTGVPQGRGVRRKQVARAFLPCSSMKEASRLDVEASHTSGLPGSWAVQSALPAGWVGRRCAGPVFPAQMSSVCTPEGKREEGGGRWRGRVRMGMGRGEKGGWGGGVGRECRVGHEACVSWCLWGNWGQGV